MIDVSYPMLSTCCGTALLLSSVGCRPTLDDTLIVGDAYACLWDVRLNCQVIGEDTGLYGEADPPDMKFEQVVGGHSHLCGIGTDGEAICWGRNDYGQADIPEGLEIDTFVLGYVNTCAVDSSGRPTCWGSDETGINEAPAGPFEMLAVAESLACGWSAEDGWSCWGASIESERVIARNIHAIGIPYEDPVSLVGGARNICMLDAEGRVSCWGSELNGVNRPTPFDQWSDLSVGTNQGCALRSGSPTCWGGAIDSYWRASVEGLWVSYVAGGRADCGIRDDGEVVCWGCDLVDPYECNWVP